mgnify:CR=1 FL=1
MNRVEEKIRVAAIEAMARRMLKDPGKNPERTARNLVEFGIVIAGGHLKDAEKKSLSRQLAGLLERQEAAEALCLLKQSVLPVK